MTRTTLPQCLHAAHTAGLIDFLTAEDPTAVPARGERGTPEFAYRAGWMSAQNALGLIGPETKDAAQ